MVGASRRRGGKRFLFPAPKEPCFALFSEGEKKSSSSIFVEGGRGSTSGWGCPGAVVAPWGWQSRRTAGPLPPFIVSVALPEIPSVGMHRTATSGDRRPCVLHPAWETSHSLTREEGGWGGHPEGCWASWQGRALGDDQQHPQHLPSLIPLPSLAGKPRSPPGRAPSAQVGNPFTASLNALLPISLPPLSSVRGQPSAFQQRTSGVPRAAGHRPPLAPSPRRRGCPQLGSPRAPGRGPAQVSTRFPGMEV